MNANLIVWDLETVPDIGGFAAANDLVGRSDVEVREAIGEPPRRRKESEVFTLSL
jgi:hypothetical protein